jgi:hypothetical protein
VEEEVGLSWVGESSLAVRIGSNRLAWVIHLAATAPTRLLGRFSDRVPARVRKSRALRNLWAGALGAGESLPSRGGAQLEGRAATGHRFVIEPRRAWLLDASVARLGDRHLGPVVLPPARARTAGVVLPRPGVFLLGSVTFAPLSAPEEAPAEGPELQMVSPRPRRVLWGGSAT